MIATNEQMKIVNRILPINFSEDEFRLTEELTHNRIFKRIDSQETNVLLDTYYNIRLNHMDECTDPENKYTYLLYTILLEVLQVRKADYNGFVKKKKIRVFRINLIAIAIGLVIYALLGRWIYAGIALALLNGIVVRRWRNIISKVGRRFKIKLSKIQEYKTIFEVLFLFDSLFVILSVRAYNSVLYLLLGYIYVFLLFRYCMKLAKSEKALKFEEKWKTIVLKVVEYGIMLWIVVCAIFPMLDTFGMIFRTSSYKYVEGICMEAKDLPFGFQKGTINNIDVVLAKRNNLEVGNLYRIIYGEYTSAIIDVKQVTVKSDSKANEDINKQIDELIEDSKREEAKKIEEELAKKEKKEKKNKKSK